MRWTTKKEKRTAALAKREEFEAAEKARGLQQQRKPVKR